MKKIAVILIIQIFLFNNIDIHSLFALAPKDQFKDIVIIPDVDKKVERINNNNNLFDNSKSQEDTFKKLDKNIDSNAKSLKLRYLKITGILIILAGLLIAVSVGFLLGFLTPLSWYSIFISIFIFLITTVIGILFISSSQSMKQQKSSVLNSKDNLKKEDSLGLNRFNNAGFSRKIQRKTKVIKTKQTSFIQKFLNAQEGKENYGDLYKDVLKELKNKNKKELHYIWYVLPVKNWKSNSKKSKKFKLKTDKETEVYWKNKILRERYIQYIDALYKNKVESRQNQGQILFNFFGKIDFDKLESSLKTFKKTAEKIQNINNKKVGVFIAKAGKILGIIDKYNLTKRYKKNLYNNIYWDEFINEDNKNKILKSKKAKHNKINTNKIKDIKIMTYNVEKKDVAMPFIKSEDNKLRKNYSDEAERAKAICKSLFKADIGGIQELDEGMAKEIIKQAEEQDKNINIIWNQRPKATVTDGGGIFYNTDRFLLEKKYYKQILNNKNNRVFQLAIFKDKLDNREFAIINVHTDFDKRRDVQFEEIFKQADKLVETGMSVFITGDFNTGPDRRDNSYDTLKEYFSKKFANFFDDNVEKSKTEWKKNGGIRDHIFFANQGEINQGEIEKKYIVNEKISSKDIKSLKKMYSFNNNYSKLKDSLKGYDFSKSYAQNIKIIILNKNKTDFWTYINNKKTFEEININIDKAELQRLKVKYYIINKRSFPDDLQDLFKGDIAFENKNLNRYFSFYAYYAQQDDFKKIEYYKVFMEKQLKCLFGKNSEIYKYIIGKNENYNQKAEIKVVGNPSDHLYKIIVFA